MGRPRKHSSVSREGIGASTGVRVKGGGGGRQIRETQSSTRLHESRLLLLIGYYTPADAARTSRSSRGEPSPTPLHPHPNQVLPAAQVGGQTFILRDAGQDNRGSMASSGIQSEGCRLPTDGRRVKTGATGGGRSTKQQTDREEAIGGEREYVWENFKEGQGIRVDLGGRRGGTRTIV